MYELHEFAAIFPEMGEDEFNVLLKDIEEQGQQVPIVVYKGKVIDGRHRLKACVILDIEPIIQEYEGDNPLAYVISANLARRHLTSSQKAMIGAKLVTSSTTTNQWTSEEEVTSEKAAKALGISKRQVARGRKVVEKAASIIKEAVNSGMVSVEDAADISEKPQTEQIQAVKKVIMGEASTLRSAVNMEKKARLAASPPQIPKGTYRVLVVDPPWPISKLITSVAKHTETDIDYPTMDISEITDLHPGKHLHSNAWVFLWTTQRFLRDAFAMMEKWGFYNRFIMVWHKPGGMKPINLPYQNAEFIVVASKGSPEFVSTKKFPIIFNADRGKHSEKPEEFYEILRRVTLPPRLDMFNRREIEGFDLWGNESGGE